MVLLLYALAFDSKEMAVTLPLALLLFEWIYRRPVALRQCRAFLVTAALTVPYIWVKAFSLNPMTLDPVYRPRFSLAVALAAMRRYHDALLYQDHFFDNLRLLLLWATMAAAAYLLRSPALKFGFGFALLAMLPVCLIPPRGGFVLYLPIFGWALYLAALMTRVASLLPAGPSPAAPAVTFLLTAAILIPIHVRARARLEPPVRSAHALSRQAIDQIRKLHPTLPRGSYLLFLDDPFPSDDWSLLFFLRMSYSDPSLWIDRIKMLRRPLTAEELTLYDLAFTYSHRRLQDVPLPKRPPPDPPLPVEFSPPRVRPGGSYVVTVQSCPGQTLDLAYGLVIDGVMYAALTRQWCTLDRFGQAAMLTPPGHRRAIVQIRKIRTQQGPWLPARGQIEVLP